MVAILRNTMAFHAWKRSYKQCVEKSMFKNEFSRTAISSQPGLNLTVRVTEYSDNVIDQRSFWLKKTKIFH